jgi:hypothetical protein
VKSLSQIHDRAGRCYELALTVVLNEPAGADLRLAHDWYTMPIGLGDRTIPGAVDGHAWILLLDDRVYDVIADKYFPQYEHAVRYRPIVGRVYTREEAARLASLHKHCGPWWSEEEDQLHLKYLLP